MFKIINYETPITITGEPVETVNMLDNKDYPLFTPPPPPSQRSKLK